MADNGRVTIDVSDGIGAISFYHPKKNALPGEILQELAAQITILGARTDVRVVILRSEGKGPFCAGASFDELLAIENLEQGKTFFMGFARVILAMKACPKFVLGRIHGKAVGGGVGLAAAADYALATEKAALKLSELALGIGPFVIGPVVEKKIGAGSFQAMSIDTDWRSADWGKAQGLYVEVLKDTNHLDEKLLVLAQKLAAFSPEAMRSLKAVFREGCEHWEALLASRAELSGKLVLSEFTRQAINAFRNK